MRWYKEIFDLLWHFGPRAMWDVAIRPRLEKEYSRDEGVLSFLERGLKGQIAQLRAHTDNELAALPEDSTSWLCLLQGEAQMPDTIRKCYESLHRNKGHHKIILITNETVNDYVSLPDYIKDKHEKGIISNTHYSDIIRCYLLWKYGGVWIDAALYVLHEVDFKNVVFYSPKMVESTDSINLKWTIGVLATSANFYLFEFSYNCLLEYWRKYNSPVVYLLLDFVFEIAYRNSDFIKRMVDAIPLNNVDLHSSRYSFNKKCDESVFQRLISNNTFLSLSWRFQYHTHTDSGELTYYGRLLQEFENQKMNQNNKD